MSQKSYMMTFIPNVERQKMISKILSWGVMRTDFLVTNFKQISSGWLFQLLRISWFITSNLCWWKLSLKRQRFRPFDCIYSKSLLEFIIPFDDCGLILPHHLYIKRYLFRFIKKYWRSNSSHKLFLLKREKALEGVSARPIIQKTALHFNICIMNHQLLSTFVSNFPNRDINFLAKWFFWEKFENF